jgi:hypothetical protein
MYGEGIDIGCLGALRKKCATISVLKCTTEIFQVPRTNMPYKYRHEADAIKRVAALFARVIETR